MIQIHLTGTAFLLPIKIPIWDTSHLADERYEIAPGYLHTVSHNRPEEWGHPWKAHSNLLGVFPDVISPIPLSRRKTGACPAPVFVYRKIAPRFLRPVFTKSSPGKASY